MFKIGQRVKIIGADHPTMKHHIGKEDCIRRPCPVVADAWDLEDCRKGSDGNDICFYSFHLEPVEN